MRSCIALLRGLNVGGRNTLSMSALVAVLERLGMANVSTYIQSGNTVFTCPEGELDGLAQRIQDAISAGHGLAPEVLLLRSEKLEAAIVSNPFPEAEIDPKTLHLFVLACVPDDPDLESLDRLRGRGERFELRGRVLYLHAPAGIGRSKLAQRIERCLGVTATGRNWRTVVRLRDMARSL